MSSISRKDAKALAGLTRNRIRTYRPYPKQFAFHEAGRTHREVALLASNQSGKSYSAAAEVYYHLSGEYPDWWPGRRYDHPTTWWISNSSFEQVRDNGQRLLLGTGGQEAFGTGIIPKRKIADYTMSRSTSDLVDTVWIYHKHGGRSSFKTKAYEQGRVKWQGWTGDGIWFDEEPPQDIYSEGLIRLNVRQGLALLTLTPLLGATEVVGYFYPEPSTSQRFLVQMVLDEAEHYTEKEREDIRAAIPEHELEARAEGRPMMGEGLIFPVAEEVFTCDPFPIPSFWPQIGGLDFGYDHPTAAAGLAIDPDHDRIYVHNEYRARKLDVGDHAKVLREWGGDGDWFRFAWPHDGNRNEDKESDTTTAQAYRKAGIPLLYRHATFPDGSNGVWAGNNEILERMRTDRWKVFRTCTGYLEERRQYHKKDGKVVRKFDDILSAARYAYMMRRSARPRTEARVQVQSSYGSGYDPLGSYRREALPVGYDPLRGR